MSCRVFTLSLVMGKIGKPSGAIELKTLSATSPISTEARGWSSTRILPTTSLSKLASPVPASAMPIARPLASQSAVSHGLELAPSPLLVPSALLNAWLALAAACRDA